MLAGPLLLLSWAACWYFFFIRFSQKTAGPAQSDTLFSISGALVLLALAFWSACMWGLAPHRFATPLLVGGGVLTLLGQSIMCAARRALPLSNRDVLMRLSPLSVRTGVYKYISHPMYVGLVLALCGSALVLGNKPALGAVLVLVPLLALRAYAESRA